MKGYQKGLILLAILVLTACTNVAVTGAQVVYNRHNLEKEFSDHNITRKAHLALHTKTKAFADANVSVATLHGEVLLLGQVPQPWQKEKAEQILKTIPNIKHIYNLLTISSPSSILTRLSDSWITTKVKGKLIASEDVDATRIKVVTENGTVYLMGIIKPEEADPAADLASNTDGVRSVVKIFSYMTISKKITKA